MVREWMEHSLAYLRSQPLVRASLEALKPTPEASIERVTFDYLVDIGGRTVKVTAPLYERLEKFRPMVRVEVGRGSDYVYDIEYLAN